MALAVPDELQRIRERVAERAKTIANEFTLGQKAVVGIAVVVFVIAGVIFWRTSSGPTYAPLFTNLQPPDVSAITAKLAASNIPYQITSNGTAILVPQKDVDSERLALAQAGLPQAGNVGLSIVDKEGITTSDFTQQVDYQQGLQGELQNTIDAINGVQSSQVDLVLPQNGPFALGNPQNAAASVLVTMEPGKQLTSGQVQAIVHLVASAVPNLDPSSVTVTDSEGDLLAGPGANQTAATDQQETQAYDNLLALQIESQLDRILGPNNSDVNVNATLNFNKIHTVTNSFVTNPKTGAPVTVPTSTNTSRTTFTGSGTTPGGALGAVVPTPLPGQVNNYNQTNTTQSNQPATIVQDVTEVPGAVTRESVSVLTNTLPKGVTRADILQLASATAGVQPARGDTIGVVVAPFSNAIANQAKRAAEEAAAAHRRAELETLAKDLAIALALLVVLFLIYRSARKSREGTLIPLPALPSMDVSPIELSSGGAEMPTAEVSIIPKDLEIPEGLMHELETSSIGEFIEQQPDEVARLLRTWMQESNERAGAARQAASALGGGE
jgi:flagellar M-ring protein FliF